MPQPSLNVSSAEMKVARSRFVLVSELSSNFLTGNVNLSVRSFLRTSRHRNSLKNVVWRERVAFTVFRRYCTVRKSVAFWRLIEKVKHYEGKLKGDDLR
jgi:hypothetical protein